MSSTVAKALGSVGRGCVKGCEAVGGLPCRLLCVLVLLGQFGVLDYYLIVYTSPEAGGWLLLDVLNLTLVLATLIISLHRQRALQAGERPLTWTFHFQSMAWFTWFLYSSTVAVKTITLFRARVVYGLDAADVMGRNILKTAIAGSGLFFFLFLLAEHSASPTSPAGRLLQDMTGSVLFDIIDSVDILEILFDGNGREKAGVAAEAALLLFATIAVVAPSITLLNLPGTEPGQQRLSRQFVVVHKMAITLLVNVPFLIMRMVFWHGFSVGVSPFIMKNFVLIAAACYEVFEYYRRETLGLEGEEGVGVGESETQLWRGSRGLSTDTSSARSSRLNDPPYVLTNGPIPSRRRHLAGVDNEGFMREVTL